MTLHVFMPRLLALGLLLGLCLALLPSVAWAAAPTSHPTLPSKVGHITEYHLPRGYGEPLAITTGPDGNLWFTNGGPTGDNAIGRLTLQGKVTEYPIPVPHCTGNPPPGIVVGPDGNLWAVACQTLTVVQINPWTGLMRTYAFQFNFTGLGQALTLGPDGNLWLLDLTNNTVDRFSLTNHTLTAYAIPTQYANAEGITRGADGNVWFTESGPGQIGRLNPTTGQITEYVLPSGDSPQTITPGPTGDTHLWFVISGGALGQINPFTGQIGQFSTPTGFAGPALSAGPDGHLWLDDGGSRGTDWLGRASFSGRLLFHDYVIPTPYGTASAITAGPDGNMWFTELYDGPYWGDKIGRITTK